MCGRVTVSDEEQQVGTANTIDQSDNGRNGIEFDRAKTEVEEPVPQQSCFLCLRGRRQVHHAVHIPCFRPELMILPVRKLIKKGVDGKPDQFLRSSKLGKRVRNGKYEEDSAIYRKLVAECYKYHGTWKKWIPFYGIVEVQEVQFNFSATTNVQDRYEIDITPIVHDDILARCKADLALQPNEGYYDDEDRCVPGRHSDSCRHNFDAGSCIDDLVRRARRREQKVKKAGLVKDCALDPTYTDRLTQSTLDGMALETRPIIHTSSIKLPTKRVDPEDSADPLLPGIEIVLGWQTRRITDEIPLTSTTTSLAVAVIWIAVVIGGMAGNWNLWVAVGQLLVASIAFLLVRLR